MVVITGSMVHGIPSHFTHLLETRWEDDSIGWLRGVVRLVVAMVTPHCLPPGDTPSAPQHRLQFRLEFISVTSKILVIKKLLKKAWKIGLDLLTTC